MSLISVPQPTCIYPKYSDRQACVNSVDPDQTLFQQLSDKTQQIKWTCPCSHQMDEHIKWLCSRFRMCMLTHCILNRLSHAIYWKSPNFNFRYTRLWDLHIPKEKWLNYLQIVETLIRCCILQRLIWVCTVCQLPFYWSPDYKGLWSSGVKILRVNILNVGTLQNWLGKWRPSSDYTDVQDNLFLHCSQLTWPSLCQI